MLAAALGRFLETPGAHVLKALVGHDLLDAERKGINGGIPVRGDFGVVITCNSRLRVRLDGDAEAWRRRLLIVRYERPRPERPERDFAGRLLAEEGPGILRWMVDGARAHLTELETTGEFALTPRQRARVDALLTGWLRAAWRDGDWDVAAGQFFSTWNHDAHVWPRARLDEIPAHWPVWAALDYGFQHPTAVLLFTEYEGTIRFVDECGGPKKLVPQHAEEIKAMLNRHGVALARLRSFVAGSDVFAQRGSTSGKTIAADYQDQGIKLIAADMDRINGWGEILRLLGDPANGRPARIVLSDRCVHTIDQIPTLQHDGGRTDDVLKTNADDDGQGGDDYADCLRYGVLIKKPARTTMGTVQFGS